MWYSRCLYIVLAFVLTACGTSSPTVRVEGVPDTSQAPVSSEPAAQASDPVANARTLYGEARYDALIDRYADGICSDSVDAAVGYWVGKAYQAQRKHDEAVSVLVCVRERVETPSVRLLRAIGANYDAVYDVDDATEAYRQALALDATAHDVRWELADLYRRQREWTAACRHYTALHEAGLDSGRLHTALGVCNTNLGRIPTAIEHLQAAYRKQPGNVEVALRLSKLVEVTKSPEYAASILQPAIEARPHAARLWRRVGLLAFKQKRYEEAIGAYERTIAEGDTAAVVHQRLGIAQVGAQKYDAAIPNLRRAYRRDTTSVASAFYLGSAYRGVDSLSLAARFYERAIDVGTQGRVLDAFLQLATVEEARGHEPTAIRAYQTALRLQPERTNLYFYLATLYDAYYRDKTVAARYYERYLSSDTVATDAARLRSYAEDRLRDLGATLHFQRGRAASRDSSGDE